MALAITTPGSPDNRRNASRHGFTLIEMLAVMGILAVMISVSISAVQYLIPDTELTAAARELASFVEDARDEAIIEGRTVFLDYSLGEVASDPQTFRAVRAPLIGREDKAEEEEHLLILTGWRFLPEGVFFDEIVIGDEDQGKHGEFRIPIHPDGSLQGHLIYLYCPEVDAYVTVKVSGLLGTATFQIGKIENEVVTEENF